MRFIAFSEKFESYRGRLTKFLNDYMEESRYIEEEKKNATLTSFKNTIDLIYTKICNQKALPKLSKAASEALYTGISKNYDNLNEESETQLIKRFDSLTSDPLFSVDSLKGGLSSKDGVVNRLSKSVQIFS
ncbi:MAG: hypothetical protein DRI57_17720 [Deltaproteobacteria bacterium]|nr:MAG: hypothetical protein DRI57_17720 [Deltaproteobacteria bacterium]